MSDTRGGVYECSGCGNVALGERPDCCDDEDATGVGATPVERPELCGVLREVFGILETGLRVCVCLMDDGESTPPTSPSGSTSTEARWAGS